MFMLNSKIFPLYSNNNTITSLTAWTASTITSITLDTGTYIIMCEVTNIPTAVNSLVKISNTDVALGATKNASIGVCVNGTDVVKIASSTTFALTVTPDANATGTIKGYLKAIKIGN